MADAKFRAQLQIDSNFDTSTIMKGLQDVRKQMGNLSANDTIFKGVDKEFAKLEALLKTLQTQQQNVTSPAGLNAYQRTLERVRESAQRISTGMQEIARNENNAFNFKEIDAYKTKLTSLQTKLGDLTKDFQKAGADMQQGFMQLGFSEKDALAAVDRLGSGEEIGKIIYEEIYRRKEEYERIKAEAEKVIEKIRTQDMPAKSVQNNIASVVNMDGTKGNKLAASNALNAEIRQTFEEGIKSGESFDMVLAKINLEVTRLGISFNDTNAFVTGLREKYSEYVNDNQRLVTATNQAEQSFNVLNNEMNKVIAKQPNLIQNAVNLSGAFLNSEDAIIDCEEEIEKLNKEMHKTNQNHLNGMSEDINIATSEMNELVDAQEDSAAAQQQMNIQQTAMNAAFDRMGNAVKNILSIGNAYRQVNKIIRQTFQDVTKLDNAFASIAMVTNYQVSDLWDQYENYSAIANKLGQSTEGAIKSSALFYQQGLNTAEALSLTEDTLKMATLANEDYTTATTQMTAALRGFHMEMDEGNRITDVYSELAANAAADVQGIAYAMSKTASIANNAGMAFETTAAFLTNMIETTQEAPENIGTAMKSIIARFTELKENVEDTDVDLEGMDFNKVDTALRSVGVALKDTTGSFRNLDDVFLELSSKWNTLTRNQQRYVATVAAGSRQQSRFIAMMEDYDRTLELVQTAQNSAGRSDEQFAKYADTITYKVNQIKNSWEELRISFLNSDSYKKGLSFVNDFLNQIKTIDPKTLLVDIGVFALVGKQIVSSIVTALKESSTTFENAWRQSVSGFGNVLREQILKSSGSKQLEIEAQIHMKGIKEGTQLTSQLVNQVKEYNQITQKQTEISNNLYALNGTYKLQNKELLVMRNNNENLKDSTLQQLHYAKQLALAYKDENTKLATIIINDKTKLNLTQEQVAQLKQLAIEQDDVKNKINSQSNALNEIVVKEQQLRQALIAAGVEESKINQLNGEQLAKLYQMLNIEKQINAEKTKGVATMERILASPIGGAVASGVSMGLTTGITTYFSTKDASQALKIGFGTAVTSVLPVIINQGFKAIVTNVLPAVATALGTALPLLATPIGATIAVGIGAAIGVSILKETSTAEHYAKKKLKQAQKEKERIEKEIQAIEDDVSKSRQERDTYKEEKESLDKIQKTYQDYSANVIHTQEEQEEFQNTLKEYAEDFPNIIKLQNDEYVVQNKLLEEQIRLSKEKAKEANNDYAVQQLKSAGLEHQKDRNTYQTTVSENDVKRGQIRKDIDYLLPRVSQDFSSIQNNLSYAASSFFYGLGDNASEYWDTLFNKDSDFYNRDGIYQNIQSLQSLNERLGGALYESLNIDFSDIKSAADITEENYEKVLQDLYTFFNTESEELANSLNADSIYSALIKPLDEDDARALEQFDKDSKEYYKKVANIAYDNFVNNGIDSKIADFLSKSISVADMDPNLDWTDDTVVNEWAKGYLDQINAGESFYEDVKKLSDAVNSLGSLSLNEITEKLDESFLNKFLTGNLETDNQIKALFENYIQNLKDDWQNAVDEADSTDAVLKLLYNFNDLTPAEIRAYTSQWTDNLLKNIPEEKRMMVGVSTLDIKDSFGLGDKEFSNMYGSVKWTDINIANYDQMLEKFTKTAREQGESQERAKEIFEEIVNEYKSLGVISFTLDDESLKNYKETVEKEFDQIQSETVQKLTMMSDGSIIDASDLEELQTWAEDNGEDWEDFYDLSTGTLKQVEVLQEAYAASAESHFQTLSRDIQMIEDGTEHGRELFEDYESYQKGLLTVSELTEKYSEDSLTYAELNYDAWKDLSNLFSKEIVKFYQTQVDYAKETYEDLNKIYDTAVKAKEKYDKAIEDGAKKEQEALKKINDALDAVKKQEDDILEKEKDIVEKTKELNEALYGTANYLSKRDSFQNYTDKIDQLSSAAQKAKEALDNPEYGDNISELVNAYGEAIHQEMVYQQALNKRKEDQKNEILGYLQGYGSQYFTMVDGFLQANYSAIDNAQMNDALKDEIYEYLDSYNAVQKEIIEGEEKYTSLLKEMKEKRKSALDDLVNLQKSTSEILKKNYEEEVNDVKEKYDAIKEADDEYISALEEAINKQKSLREKESKWQDLATQEKKLSLMQRDTSGTQQKDVLKLEQEVQKSRESLLDSAIDDIVKTLKETYEEQQKAREEELEYQQQVLEDMNFMAAALEVLQNISSPEEYLAWLMQNDPEYQDMTEYEQLQYIENHQNDFAALQAYYDLTNANFEQYLQTTADEVNEVMASTSDNMNEYLQRSHQTVIDTVQEEQLNAEEALSKAYEDLDEAILKLDELNLAVDEAQQNYAKAIEDAKANTEEARKAYNEAMDSVYKTGAKSVEDMATKVDEAFAKYNKAQGDAEIQLTNYKNNLVLYMDSIGELGNALAKANSSEEANKTKSAYDDMFSRAEEANRILAQIKRIQNQGEISAEDSNTIASLQQSLSSLRNASNNYYYMIGDDSIGYTLKHYATGGLVNFTGPAWVDGTPTKPEAFLSAEDTARIGAAAKLLSNIPALNSSSVDNSYSSNIGDTTIEVHINVENISSEIDIDDAVKRVEDDIVQMSNSIGKSVYLNK